ncbi:MAG: SIS domain-containing protein [Floccifex porci]|uniref:SIS domain-containing protein n=1 Tax=Floccifex porci TaxID=2606629 RepID=A0A7X2T3K4_9FIRM|nr:SIS domain-containing protein [Floccifex porci]MCI7802538.1 SIS domain-containing protein [Erysipelotrichaceae bacterium]MDD7466512.1 SIS domain-containing protein [Floccifex porci]MDY4796612.1 SIS domain-containing protein [Floccifex porci]MSS00801.1 SIS domain-containing protein [Floccifex porci]
MLFNKTEENWKELNGYWTAKEILQQPATWAKTIAQVKNEKDAIKAFIERTTKNEDYDIILTGAGTSEFVGNSIYAYLSKKNNYKVKSYATTDIVADPESYLSRTKPTLLISYGRSGNSPESVAAVEVANTVCENINHLFVTCNANGALSKFAVGKENCYAINLTPETHDQSFAMTSSYSNMYLATLLAFNIDDLDAFSKQVEVVIEKNQAFLDSTWTKAKDVVDEFDFKRIVYLGSNNNKGVAQESALKMCELNGGTIDTVFDTPMGFRHGPKSVINPETLCVVYLSDEPYTRQYEYDIIKEMSPERKGNKILVVSSKDDDIKEYADYFISFDNGQDLPNVLLGLEYITVAQTIALFKSLKSGYTPDNPCPSGEVNRVVKGVIIYPYSK